MLRLIVLMVSIQPCWATQSGNNISLHQSLVNKLTKDNKNLEVVEFYKGKTQKRKFYATEKFVDAKLVIAQNQAHILSTKTCRMEVKKTWSDQKKKKHLDAIYQKCQKDLIKNYPSMYQSKDAYCSQPLIFKSNSKNPHDDLRSLVAGSREKNRECIANSNAKHEGDYEIYYSALLMKKK